MTLAFMISRHFQASTLNRLIPKQPCVQVLVLVQVFSCHSYISHNPQTPKGPRLAEGLRDLIGIGAYKLKL